MFEPVTLENYYELRSAIFSGAQTVSYSHPGGNKSVTYRSLQDMMTLLRMLEGALGLTSGRGRRTYAAFSKGTRPVGANAGDCGFNRDCRPCRE